MSDNVYKLIVSNQQVVGILSKYINITSKLSIPHFNNLCNLLRQSRYGSSGLVLSENLHLVPSQFHFQDILKAASEILITQKEISPGIILLKQVTSPDLTYIFKVQLNRLNILEFTADFTGSENILLDGTEKMYTITNINPFETKEVAKLIMKYDWKLKTKFKFTLKPTSKETQLKYIKNDVQQLQTQQQQMTQILNKYPIQVKEISEIIKYLGNQQFIDPDFPPHDDSIYGYGNVNQLDTLIQWRRPTQFFQQKDANKRPEVFFDKIEPSDIKQGALGNCWFLSALSSLAERPALVRRLFITNTVNSQGIYRVKICKNGEWQYVTIDDLFPCYPLGTPIFSSAHGNELWVLIIEKAYAKLHGNYYSLRFGLSSEAMIDLTGCPTKQVLFDEPKLKSQTHELWLRLKKYDEEGYLINAFTEGHDSFSEADRDQIDDTVGLVPGHAYAVLTIRVFKGIQLLNLRNPWGDFEWKGDWSDTSPLWTQEIKNEVNFVNDLNDGLFWMCFNDFIHYFKGVNICKVRNWEEVRIKGKFIKVQDVEDNNIEVVMSKWFYTFTLQQAAKIVVGLHQEDERCQCVSQLRNYLDIGLVILKKNDNNSLDLVGIQQTKVDRQVELELDLNIGNYIIVPRTSGLFLKRQQNAKQVPLMINDQMNPLLESTICDIFRKYDMLLTKELSFIEFKGLYETIEKQLDPQYFKTQILQRYQSSDKGLTQKGLINYFKDQLNLQGEEVIWRWLDKLGYDKDLFSVKSRSFILTLHSSIEVAITVRDSLQTDLDNRSHIFAASEQSEFTQIDYLKFEHEGIRALQTYNRLSEFFTVIAINDQTYPIDLTIDYGQSQGLLFSNKSGCVRKKLEPGQMEFIMHFKSQGTQKVKLLYKCKWLPA